MEVKGLIFFMKKLIIVIITIIVACLVYINVNADEIVIPDAAIRVRVIANSNTIEDQSMKMKVKEYIDNYLSVQMVDIDSVDEARDIISGELNNINYEIREIFDNNNYDKDFVVHFGDNYFPDKEYKGITYRSGSYESLVISIGEGNGDNWWCVLFPPLCLLEASENEVDDVEYQFFVTKMLDKIFS